ncbi:hypothetical protein [Dickeya parazeae]|uniref:hypothetical protein n=1 Tax=Dickeya parazeae TaxID=2893572 RepID=UPI001AEC8B6D|nr:hypothetical protein [Dickeya parazeae]
MTGSYAHLRSKITAKTSFSTIIATTIFKGTSQKGAVNALLTTLIVINIVYKMNSIINGDYFHFSLSLLFAHDFVRFGLKCRGITSGSMP